MEPPHCPWLAHFSFRFRVENLGCTCPGGPQLLQPRELQRCYGAPLFPSLQSLQPLAWHSLGDSRTQRVLQPRSSFALSGLGQSGALTLSKPGAPGAVTSALRDPRASSCSPGINPAVRRLEEHLVSTFL